MSVRGAGEGGAGPGCARPPEKEEEAGAEVLPRPGAARRGQAAAAEGRLGRGTWGAVRARRVAQGARPRPRGWAGAMGGGCGLALPGRGDNYAPPVLERPARGSGSAGPGPHACGGGARVHADGAGTPIRRDRSPAGPPLSPPVLSARARVTRCRPLPPGSSDTAFRCQRRFALCSVLSLLQLRVLLTHVRRGRHRAGERDRHRAGGRHGIGTGTGQGQGQGRHACPLQRCQPHLERFVLLAEQMRGKD